MVCQKERHESPILLYGDRSVIVLERFSAQSLEWKGERVHSQGGHGRLKLHS